MNTLNLNYLLILKHNNIFYNFKNMVYQAIAYVYIFKPVHIVTYIAIEYLQVLFVN